MSDREDINATLNSIEGSVGANELSAYQVFMRMKRLVQAAQAQAVNQQLLEALVEVRSCMAIGIPEFSLHDREVMIQADDAIDAAIAAAQEQGK
jgi:hypothetical protein